RVKHPAKRIVDAVDHQTNAVEGVHDGSAVTDVERDRPDTATEHCGERAGRRWVPSRDDYTVWVVMREVGGNPSADLAVAADDQDSVRQWVRPFHAQFQGTGRGVGSTRLVRSREPRPGRLLAGQAPIRLRPLSHRGGQHVFLSLEPIPDVSSVGTTSPLPEIVGPDRDEVMDAFTACVVW